MQKKVRFLIYTMIGIICTSIICLIIIGVTDKQKEYKSDSTTEITETTIKETITTTKEVTTEESTTEETTTEAETITVKPTKPKTTKVVETTKIETTKKTESTESSEYISLGEFKLTAYCNCSTCCGKWSGSPTASGAMPKANHTIAVDTSVIPFGTEVIINGNTYVAEDTGSAIKGNKIDIYMSSHEEALNFGVRYAEVLIINK